MYLVLDTNIYLHFKSYEQIPWEEELLCKDITFLVPLAVLEEIDRVKDSEKGRVQKRAKAVSSRFGELFLEGKPGKYPVQFIEAPFATEAEKEQYRLDRDDNLILFSIKRTGINTNEVCIVSSDNAMLIRAKQMGFRIHQLNEKYRSPVELTKEEKEAKSAIDELNRIRNRQPVPRLFFIGGESSLRIPRPTRVNYEEEVSRRMNELELKWPKMTRQNSHVILAGQSYMNLSNGQIAAYNTSVERFLTLSEKKIRLEIAHDALNQRMFRFAISMSNLGTAPTGKTNVFIYFPKDIHVFSSVKTRRFAYEKPELPSIVPSVKSFFPYKDCSGPSIELWNLDSFEKESEFSTVCEPLNHHLSCKLFEFYIDSATCPDFTIHWKIADAELLDLVSGELRIGFSKDE